MLTKIGQDHPVYKRAVIREGRFWKGQPDDPGNPTQLPPSLQRYRQEHESGDQGKDRYAYLASLGPFRQGLSIGCGSAVVEIELLRRGIVEQFTFIDISEESLQTIRDRLPDELRRRVRIVRQDLNFIRLERDAYDFIFCANVLHHIINLEHVLLALNSSMRKDGILYVDDFIGENRFQFSDARIAMLNAAAQLAHERTGVRTMPMQRTSRTALINSCPFEAVRSEDLPILLRGLFGRTTMREARYGAISSWMNVVVDMKDRKADEAARIFVALDRPLVAQGLLPPMFIIGVYRKNARPPRWTVKRWTEKEIKEQLPVSRFDESIAHRIAAMLQRGFGEGPVYRFAKNTYFKLRR